VAAARRAVSLDPRMSASAGLGQILIYARRYSEAQVASKMRKSLLQTRTIRSGHHERLPRLRPIREGPESMRSASTPLDAGDRHYCLALVYHALSRRLMPNANWNNSSRRWDTAVFRYAEVYAQWGDKVSALHWLARLNNYTTHLGELRVDPFLDPIRTSRSSRQLKVG